MAAMFHFLQNAISTATQHRSARSYLSLMLRILLLPVLAFALSACSSLPEGTSAPKLNIESVVLHKDATEPYFVVNYVLEHNSAAPLPVVAVSADVFLNDIKVASTYESYSNNSQMISPHEQVRLSLTVPVKYVGAAAMDSLSNNSLLILQGACAMTVSITHDQSLKSLNPSSSYNGLIGVER